MRLRGPGWLPPLFPLFLLSALPARAAKAHRRQPGLGVRIIGTWRPPFLLLVMFKAQVVGARGCAPHPPARIAAQAFQRDELVLRAETGLPELQRLPPWLQKAE